MLFTSGIISNKKVVAPTTNNEVKGININLKPISAEDHILGKLDAPIIIVEYSDLECPFCKVFHRTMHEVMDKYGKDNKVAWIYRQFPIDSLHSKARKEAEATECANELGGNDGFWKFTDEVFGTTNSNVVYVHSRYSNPSIRFNSLNKITPLS